MATGFFKRALAYGTVCSIRGVLVKQDRRRDAHHQGFVAVSNETTERLFVMRSMLKSVLVALVAVLALGTAIAATASASELKWEVKEGETWKVLEKGSRKITIKQQGAQVFSFPTSYHAEIRCEKLEGTGAIYAEGTGEFTLKYTGCKVVMLPPIYQTCGWVSSPEQPNGTIVMGGLPARLVAKEGAIYYEVEENPTTKEFDHIIINKEEREGGEGKCGLITREYHALKGSFLGKMNNATSELESAGEGTLKLGTVPLEYFGRDLLEVEGGGAIRAS